jgi:hypothetical protein
MKREDLLKEMKSSIGVKEPVEFFSKMVDVFGLMFDRLDLLERENQQLKIQTALSIEWEPKLASTMLAKQVEILRKDKELFFEEISALKKAFAEDLVTQNYIGFCNFWTRTLGWHPFLDYSK